MFFTSYWWNKKQKTIIFYQFLPVFFSELLTLSVLGVRFCTYDKKAFLGPLPINKNVNHKFCAVNHNPIYSLRFTEIFCFKITRVGIWWICKVVHKQGGKSLLKGCNTQRLSGPEITSPDHLTNFWQVSSTQTLKCLDHWSSEPQRCGGFHFNGTRNHPFLD